MAINNSIRKFIPEKLREKLRDQKLPMLLLRYALENEWFCKKYNGINDLTVLTDSTVTIEIEDMKFHLPSLRDIDIISEVIIDRRYNYRYEFKAGDTMIDIGAHVGVFSVLAAKMCGQKSLIIALEPEPSNQRLLEENISTNNVKERVIVIKGAVGSIEENRNFYLSKYSQDHSFQGIDQTDKAINKFMTVKMHTIDSIVEQLHLSTLILLK